MFVSRVAFSNGRFRFVIQVSLFVVLTSFSSGALAQNEVASGKLLTVWAGVLPIILSAPHGGRQPIPGVAVRRGVGVAQFATGRDSNTDELAVKTAGKLEERFGVTPF
jgi:hypothetical protein